jgi:hypothetical protein
MRVELSNRAVKQYKRLNEPLVIETDLTAEEKADIAEGRRLFEEHPETFTDWEDVKKELGLS